VNFGDQELWILQFTNSSSFQISNYLESGRPTHQRQPVLSNHPRPACQPLELRLSAKPRAPPAASMLLLHHIIGDDSVGFRRRSHATSCRAGYKNA
jgi:hypothetical protein